MHWSRVVSCWLAVATLLVSATSGAADRAQADTQPVRTRQAPDANTCLSCHLTLSDDRLRKVALEFQNSVHRDERIGCAGCHHGTPTDPTIRAHDPKAGFVARPPRDTMAALCGGCHADPVFVRQFNARLPVDQEKLFELSVHGKLAARSDPKAPTCSDCHGTHHILPVSAVDAPVNPNHVVELCGRCHADPEHMKGYEVTTDQVQKWRASRHGVAFLAGNLQAPTCSGCHSPHAGTLETFSAAALCGRCHEEQRRLFASSPHQRPFRKLGLAECVPCHGDHGVAKTTWLAGMGPEAACGRCHERGDAGAQVAVEIARRLREVDEREHDARMRLSRAEKSGLYAPDATLALARFRSDRIELGAKVHDLDLDHLSTTSERLLALSREAELAIEKSERARTVEVRGYYVAILVCALLFALLVLKAVRLARGRSGSGK